MHIAAHEHQPFGSVDQAREDIGCEGIHSRKRSNTIVGLVIRNTEKARIVDYDVEGTERIDLLGQFLGFGGAGQVARYDRLGARARGGSISGALRVARMENDTMTARYQAVRNHRAEAVGGSCDEYASHGGILRWWK
jgi:hypothetical protein